MVRLLLSSSLTAATAHPSALPILTNPPDIPNAELGLHLRYCPSEGPISELRRREAEAGGCPSRHPLPIADDHVRPRPQRRYRGGPIDGPPRRIRYCGPRWAGLRASRRRSLARRRLACWRSRGRGSRPAGSTSMPTSSKGLMATGCIPTSEGCTPGVTTYCGRRQLWLRDIRVSSRVSSQCSDGDYPLSAPRDWAGDQSGIIAEGSIDLEGTSRVADQYKGLICGIKARMVSPALEILGMDIMPRVAKRARLPRKWY